MFFYYVSIAVSIAYAAGQPTGASAATPSGTDSSTDPQAGGLSKSQPLPQLLKENPDDFYLPAPTAEPGIDTQNLPPSNNSDVHPLDGSWFGTGLFGYDECKKRGLNKAKINDAYYDMYYLTNTDGIYKDIDWNSAAALEYLGPPANNKKYQARIQKLLLQASATSSGYGKNIHYIHVRCDDPAGMCTKDCGPDGTDEGKAKTIAYASQSDEKGYSQINFCPPFFDKNRLRNTAIDYGKGLGAPKKYWADKYDNTARIFLHELMHLDYFMDVSSGDHVWDLTIQLKNSGSIQNVYGPTYSKVMARYQAIPQPPEEPYSGYYVSRNADSMAWYATARYVQDKLGVYPHLPIVSLQADGPPWKDPGSAFYATYSDGSNPSFNISSDVLNAESTAGQCRDDTTTASAPADLTISGMAEDSAYPDDYNKQRADWIKIDLGSPTTTTGGPTSTPTCSGNQVEGNCKAASLPSAAPFSGNQGPSCDKADGSAGAEPRLNQDKFKNAASGYCDSLIGSKTVLKDGNANPKPAILKGEAEGDKDMVLTTMYYQTSCPSSKANTTLDFSEYGRQACFDAFFTPMDTVCAQDSTWGDYNKDFTEMGGVYATNCGLFAVTSQ